MAKRKLTTEQVIRLQARFKALKFGAPVHAIDTDKVRRNAFRAIHGEADSKE